MSMPLKLTAGAATAGRERVGERVHPLISSLAGAVESVLIPEVDKAGSSV